MVSVHSIVIRNRCPLLQQCACVWWFMTSRKIWPTSIGHVGRWDACAQRAVVWCTVGDNCRTIEGPYQIRVWRRSCSNPSKWLLCCVGLLFAQYKRMRRSKDFQVSLSPLSFDWKMSLRAILPARSLQKLLCNFSCGKRDNYFVDIFFNLNPIPSARVQQKPFRRKQTHPSPEDILWMFYYRLSF